MITPGDRVRHIRHGERTWTVAEVRGEVITLTSPAAPGFHTWTTVWLATLLADYERIED